MEEEVKNNYALGALGALVGAFIGAIPWILMYVFGNMMYSLLAILIVLCSFYGYKLTKAKIDKKVPVILSIASFISITVTMFVIIPMCLMAKEGMPISMEDFVTLYQYDEFTSAMIQDYIVALLFCLVVIGGIVYNLNKQIKEGKESKDIKLLSNDVSNEVFSNEDIEKVKAVFEKSDAMTKNHTISKELVMEELYKEFDEQKANGIFNYLKAQRIIKKKSRQYYFSEKAQSSAWHRYGVTSLKTFVIVMVLAIIIAGVIIFVENDTNNDNLNELQDSALTDTTRSNVYDVGVDNLKLEFPEDIVILTQEETAYYFGEMYASAYDCLAMSSDFSKMVMVFSDDKSNYDVYTAEEYLKAALDNAEIEVKEQEISGHTFYMAEQTYEEDDGNSYVEADYVYDAGDRFICMIFDSLESDRIDVSQIIK